MVRRFHLADVRVPLLVLFSPPPIREPYDATSGIFASAPTIGRSLN
jgi:hypothetical protein